SLDEWRELGELTVAQDDIRNAVLLASSLEILSNLFEAADQHGRHREHVGGGYRGPTADSRKIVRGDLSIRCDDRRGEYAEFQSGEAVAGCPANDIHLVRHIARRSGLGGVSEHATAQWRREKSDRVSTSRSDRQHARSSSGDQHGRTRKLHRRRIVDIVAERVVLALEGEQPAGQQCIQNGDGFRQAIDSYLVGVELQAGALEL